MSRTHDECDVVGGQYVASGVPQHGSVPPGNTVAVMSEKVLRMPRLGKRDDECALWACLQVRTTY